MIIASTKVVWIHPRGQITNCNNTSIISLRVVWKFSEFVNECATLCPRLGVVWIYSSQLNLSLEELGVPISVAVLVCNALSRIFPSCALGPLVAHQAPRASSHHLCPPETFSCSSLGSHRVRFGKRDFLLRISRTHELRRALARADMPPRLPPRSTTSRSATGEDGGAAVVGRDERLGQEGEVDKDAEVHFCASSQHCLHGENVA
jgi:hypothetical protein